MGVGEGGSLGEKNGFWAVLGPAPGDFYYVSKIEGKFSPRFSFIRFSPRITGSSFRQCDHLSPSNFRSDSTSGMGGHNRVSYACEPNDFYCTPS